MILAGVEEKQISLLSVGMTLSWVVALLSIAKCGGSSLRSE